jgi:hypothetical protein
MNRVSVSGPENRPPAASARSRIRWCALDIVVAPGEGGRPLNVRTGDVGRAAEKGLSNNRKTAAEVDTENDEKMKKFDCADNPAWTDPRSLDAPDALSRAPAPEAPTRRTNRHDAEAAASGCRVGR